jgi:hypothetical protein
MDTTEQLAQEEWGLLTDTDGLTIRRRWFSESAWFMLFFCGTAQAPALRVSIYSAASEVSSSDSGSNPSHLFTRAFCSSVLSFLIFNFQVSVGSSPRVT